MHYFCLVIHLQFSIANILKASKCEVPEWIFSLPKLSKSKRSQKGSDRKKQAGSDRSGSVSRRAISTIIGASVGKRDANRRRDMVVASRKRKERQAKEMATNDA